MNSKLYELKNNGTFVDSITENNAINLFDKIEFNSIKSIGISTAGFIEGYYASKGKRVVATTLDNDGIEYMKSALKDVKGSNNIEYRLEDASKISNDKDNSFDILYSRMCLHYLTDDELSLALNECYRILKPNGIFFIALKSANDRMAKSSNSKIDDKTGLTVVSDYELYSNQKRRFHTIESISEAVQKAGFRIESIDELKERLCKDWERKILSDSDATVIQLIVRK